MEVTLQKQEGPTVRAAIGVAVIVLVTYWFVTTRTTLWGMDEARFSRATVEMVESGNYLYPTFNGDLRPDKPILIYWLMSMPVRLLGPTELACRFCAPIGMATTCLLVWLVGRKLFSRRAALLAMIMLASTPIVLLVGSAATTDAVLLACIWAAIAAFVLSMVDGVKAWHVVLMTLALTAALLTKGPVGWVIPLLAIVTTLLIGMRGAVPLGKKYVPWLALAFVVGLGLALIWAIPANNATHGDFYRLGIGHHVIARTETPLQHHGGNFLQYLFFYPLVILLGFLPWTMFLPGMISALCAGRLGGRMGRAFLLGATLPTVVMMTLVQTKLPHYILPIWPALALGTAATIDAAERGALAPRDLRWLRRGVWFFAPLMILFALGIAMAPLMLPIPGLQARCFIAAAVIYVTAWIAIRQHLFGTLRSSVISLLTAIVLIEGTLVFGVLPVVEKAKVIPALARQVAPRLTKDTPVFATDVSRATLNFYIGRHINYLHQDEVPPWARASKEGVLIIDRLGLQQIERKFPGLDLVAIADAGGYDYARGDWLELEAVVPSKSAMAGAVGGR